MNKKLGLMMFFAVMLLFGNLAAAQEPPTPTPAPNPKPVGSTLLGSATGEGFAATKTAAFTAAALDWIDVVNINLCEYDAEYGPRWEIGDSMSIKSVKYFAIMEDGEPKWMCWFQAGYVATKK